MKNRVLSAACGIAAMIATQQALAVPFSSYDPRSFAMGGVGVAAATSGNAVFFNPALLAAARQDEDFSFNLFAGARAADPNKMVDAVDTFNSNDSMTAFSNAIIAYNSNINSTTAADVQTTGNQLIADLNSISGKDVMLEGDAGIVVGIPSKKYGVSIYGNAWAIGGGNAKLDSNDLTIIQNTMSAADGTNPITSNPVNTNQLFSSVNTRFAEITEAGVALAREFDGIAVGITPKWVKVKTYDYQFVGSQIDNASIDLSQGDKTDSNFNMDIGLARDFANGWKAGLAVKNVLAQEYTTVLNHKIKIAPMARAGATYQNSWFTVGMDVDLTENDPGGFDTKTQFAALGAEFDLFDTAQLRLGVRHNMSDTPYDPDTLSAGLGLSPFGVHVDISVAGNADEVGAALQLGFRF